MIKLQDIYKNKFCPNRIGYMCDNVRCAKFISCMVNEIDALHEIGGINTIEIDELDRELISTVQNAHDNC